MLPAFFDRRVVWNRSREFADPMQDAGRLLNRELSWLEFDRRSLALAEETARPLLDPDAQAWSLGADGVWKRSDGSPDVQRELQEPVSKAGRAGSDSTLV